MRIKGRRKGRDVRLPVDRSVGAKRALIATAMARGQFGHVYFAGRTLAQFVWNSQALLKSN